MASVSPTRTANHSAENAEPQEKQERIRQGITSNIVGRLTEDPKAVGQTATSLRIAVNVPHKDADGKFQDSTTFLQALAVGAADREIKAGGVHDLRKGAIVSLKEVPLENVEYVRDDQSKGRSLEAKVFDAGNIKVLQLPKAKSAGAAGAMSDEAPI
jgi:hypothetical protein